jgi:hypothetical protein
MSNNLHAILAGGFIAGTIDIGAASEISSENARCKLECEY